VRVLASGRDCDVYAYGEGSVLRRYREGRPAEREAAIMRTVAALGYPAPTVRSVAGPDIVMERVDGPTLGETMVRGRSPDDVGRTLARLHERLHELAWPDAKPGESILHLDLHPLNVIMRGASPVVIDWSNARPGPAALDVAMTALIMAQVVVMQEVPGSAGLDVPDVVAGRMLITSLDRALRTFSRCAGGSYKDQLPAAGELRSRDSHQSSEERTALEGALGYAASLT
jgi:aminoglycoside phosphotransferase (APT) family kinase protein